MSIIKKPVKVMHNSDTHGGIFVLSWVLGNSCNYACEYCPPHLHDCTNSWIKYEKVISTLDKIIQYVRNRNMILYVDFSGGEVTLNEDLIKIAKYLKSNNCRVGILSNGSRDISYWRMFAPYIDQICLSFHPLFANPDHFHSVVGFLHNKVITHVNLLMHPDCFDVCKELGQRITDNFKDFSLSYQPVLKMLEPGSELYDYSEQQKTEILSLEQNIKITRTRRLQKPRGMMKIIYSDGSIDLMSAPQLLTDCRNDWKGWHCNAGLEQIIIDVDGNIYRAWCMQDPMGTIREIDRLLFPDTPIICKTNNCNCLLDITITKEHSPNDTTESIPLTGKYELSIATCVAFDDTSINGKSNAVISFYSDTKCYFTLDARESNAEYTYAAMSVHWIRSDVQNDIRGIQLNMDIELGKILVIKIPLPENEDYDYFEYELIGKGSGDYIISFVSLSQQGWGKPIKWEFSNATELLFYNDMFDNRLDLKINRIYFYR